MYIYMCVCIVCVWAGLCECLGAGVCVGVSVGVGVISLETFVFK